MTVESHREAQSRYRTSPKGRETQRRYRASGHGRDVMIASNERRLFVLGGYAGRLPVELHAAFWARVMPGIEALYAKQAEERAETRERVAAMTPEEAAEYAARPMPWEASPTERDKLALGHLADWDERVEEWRALEDVARPLPWAAS